MRRLRTRSTSARSLPISRPHSGLFRSSAIEKFKSGQSNPTYLLDAASGRYVLRAKPPGQLLKSAHQVDREFRVMKALGRTTCRCRRVLHLSAEDLPIGRMFYVMAFVEGRIFWDPALPEIADNGERAAIYDAMNATLAALHDVDIRPSGLGDFGRPGSYFERQLAAGRASTGPPRPATIADMDRLIAWLESNLPADDGQGRAGAWRLPAGQHDFRARTRRGRGGARLGAVDARPSLRRSRLSVHAVAAAACLGFPRPRRHRPRALGLPSEADYVAAYCRRRGIDGIANWTFLLAFSFFRLAAICQGVYKRALDGNASNPDKARMYGEAVGLLAGLAVRLIDEDG